MFNSIPTVTRNLLVTNIVVFLATIIFQRQVNLEDWGSLHFFLASDFHLYQFITYQFMHGSFAHLFFNMFALWMFGCVIENTWGAKRFLVYYLVCGIGAGLCQEVVQYVTYASEGLANYTSVDMSGKVISMSAYLNLWGTIGASGAVYGILLAFGMLYPENRIFVFPLPVPIKAKWFVVIYAVLEIILAWTSPGDSVAHVAHLGGMLFGLLLIVYWRKHPEKGSISMGSILPKKKRKKKEDTIDRTRPGFGSTREDDMEYNRRKQERQAEVDAILDKIRKSGYDSLTKEEKQRLFEASRER